MGQAFSEQLRGTNDCCGKSIKTCALTPNHKNIHTYVYREEAQFKNA